MWTAREPQRERKIKSKKKNLEALRKESAVALGVGPAVLGLTSCHTKWCFSCRALIKLCLNETKQIVAAVAVPPSGSGADAWRELP